jgi:hypothetical protein
MQNPNAGLRRRTWLAVGEGKLREPAGKAIIHAGALP